MIVNFVSELLQDLSLLLVPLDKSITLLYLLSGLSSPQQYGEISW